LETTKNITTKTASPAINPTGKDPPTLAFVVVVLLPQIPSPTAQDIIFSPAFGV
jgi:hypothetical protein